MKSYLAALPLLALCVTATAAEPPAKTAPKFSSCTKPAWPKEALRREYQGTVTVAMLIGVDGTVREARIEKSSGHEMLDLATQEGMARCIFKPAMQNGQPVETWIKMQYVWTLDGPSAAATAANLATARAGAERGDPEAQFKLALIYLNSQGVTQDLAEARKWLHKAASQNHAAAQLALARLYDNGQGVEKDADKARQLREQSIRK
ncbi:TonB family protein [Duganella sp. BuS-21]|uniref:TonB family protein n=1 Tax=Duganella sp. BuS-21 TaxID=2943848 RepID=UPI0035A6F927